MRENVLCRVLPLLFVAASLGCQTTARPVEVGLGDQINEDASVVVHLAGVRTDELSAWRAYPMSQYWDRSDAFKRDALAGGAVREVNLGAGGAGRSYTLSADDPIWAAWADRGATTLVVLTNVPRNPPDRLGDLDPRRRTFDLAPSGSPEPIRLRVEPGGLQVAQGTE